MCENGVGSDVRNPREDQGHDMRQPQSSSRSLNSQFPRHHRLDRVCLINITQNDCCLSGLYHLDRGHLSSGLRTKLGGKKNSCKEGKKNKKTWKKPQKDAQSMEPSLQMDRTDVTCPDKCTNFIQIRYRRSGIGFTTVTLNGTLLLKTHH